MTTTAVAAGTASTRGQRRGGPGDRLAGGRPRRRNEYRIDFCDILTTSQKMTSSRSGYIPCEHVSLGLLTVQK
jgi:hypothetical protein